MALAERPGRRLERRVAGATGRGGRGRSVENLSAAAVDISRLVTASARLSKLDRPEPDTDRYPAEALDELVRRIEQRKGRKGESG